MIRSIVTTAVLASFFLLPSCCLAWQVGKTSQPINPPSTSSSSTSSSAINGRLANGPAAVSSSSASTTRRSILLSTPILALSTTTIISPNNPALAADPTKVPDLTFTTTPSGLQYADVKPGSTTSTSPTNGQAISVDYVMSTTGARYGSKIYSTQDAGAPYRWTLGDGSTIPGLEEAVKGMTPGGIRRLIIPPKLAYQSSSSSIREECQNGKGLGPIPPVPDAVGEFQRFKNIYCNPDRQYQPDLVLDVKLYGKR